MNQTLTPAIEAVMDIVRASGLFSSLATFQQPTTVDAMGVVTNDYEDVVDFVGIACTAPPASVATIKATENRTPAEIEASLWLHVLLDNWYPGIADGWRGEQAGAVGPWRVLIDGKAYDLAGVESDSQKQMTRLTARLTTL